MILNGIDSGNLPRPGEISLAHCGVLFLDEIAEFQRRVLDVLRQPMESGVISISRAARQAEFPARFQLIAAMNPCPCGYLGHASGRCRCTPDAVLRYRSRLSGPLLDRIDLQIEVAAMPPAALGRHAGAGESTQSIATRVAAAFALQLARQGKANQRLSSTEIEQHCRLESHGEQLLHGAMARLHWSARTYHRVLRVARSIADLASSPTITQPHVAEAIQYRRVLREM